MTFILAASSPLDHVVPQGIVPIDSLGIWLTNHMVMSLVAAVLMLLLFPAIFARPRSEAPSGVRNFFESILQFLRNEVFQPALKGHTDRFTPFLWTVFFFILFCNLLGFIPLSELVTVLSGGKAGHWNHVGGTATGNIATTAALAFAAFVFIHLNGIWQVARELIAGTYGHHDHHDASHDPSEVADTSHGPHGLNPAAAVIAAPALYLWNFAPHMFKPKPGESQIAWLADLPIWGLLLVLDLVGAVIKPFALCMRLFANMIAGHIVLAVLAGLIPVTLGLLAQLGIGIPITAMSLGIRMLELFVSFLQAYIFTFLTTLFVAAAVAPEH